MKSKANAVAKVCCISIVSLKGDCSFIPHEFACLNHSVPSAAHHYAPPTGHTHFTLRQKPQASVQLRNEILQKGCCQCVVVYSCAV